eukprot:3717253-Rhodomonas_salina.2
MMKGSSTGMRHRSCAQLLLVAVYTSWCPCPIAANQEVFGGSLGLHPRNLLLSEGLLARASHGARVQFSFERQGATVAGLSLFAATPCSCTMYLASPEHVHLRAFKHASFSSETFYSQAQSCMEVWREAFSPERHLVSCPIWHCECCGKHGTDLASVPGRVAWPELVL